MINTTIMTVTPSKAKKMLEMNLNNRPLNGKHVAFIVSEIKNGNWRLNGESIKIGKDRLIDGQHRLQAIVQSGKSMKTVVMTGIDDDVFDTVDTGRARKHADILALNGEKNTAALASLLIMLHRYYGENWKDTKRMSNSEIEKLLEKYPDARASVAHNYRATGLFVPKIINLCHYVFSNIDKDQADYFISSMCSGANLSSNNPIYTLRNKVMTAKLTGARHHPDTICTMAFKAWNMIRQGKKSTRLHVKSTDTPDKAV